jgi:hypothetical protein
LIMGHKWLNYEGCNRSLAATHLNLINQTFIHRSKITSSSSRIRVALNYLDSQPLLHKLLDLSNI